MLNARQLVGSCDILFVTLDTLRYDVATAALNSGLTPNLAAVLPGRTWERRHTPGSFTWSAHHAFFAGFLPTPASPGPHPRLFAPAFPGSESIGPATCVFDAPDIVHGLADRGYHTICIGGVGFFNKKTPMACVMPELFLESHWHESFGVTSRFSTQAQVDCALESLARLPADKQALLFLNVSAMHQPNCIFADRADADSPQTQAAALAYADGHLGRLITAMRRRRRLLCILCSDHGTLYGEDGFRGHRLAHPLVWEVPYAEFVLDCQKASAE